MWPLGRPWRPPPPSAHGAPFKYIPRRTPFVTRAAKGAWKVPISAPVYLRDVHLRDVPRTTHAKEQQEAHLRAPASLRLDPPCPRRPRLDQNTRAWRTWSLLWGTEVRKSPRKPECVETRPTKNKSKATKCARVPSAAFLVAIRRPCAPARARKTRAALRAASLLRWHASRHGTFISKRCRIARSIAARVNQAAVPHEPPRF